MTSNKTTTFALIWFTQQFPQLTFLSYLQLPASLEAEVGFVTPTEKTIW